MLLPLSGSVAGTGRAASGGAAWHSGPVHGSALWEILAATRSGSGLRAEADTVSYTDDSRLSPELLWDRVCEQTGTRSFEEFWEKYYECRGLALSTEEFVRQVNAWCLLARENTPREELLADGCLARESHMACRIRESGQSYGKILVVAGGFHLWGLLHPEKDRQNATRSRRTVRQSIPCATLNLRRTPVRLCQRYARSRLTTERSGSSCTRRI